MERMCTRMRASLPVSGRKRNDVTHLCRHVAGALAGVVAVAVAADDADVDADIAAAAAAVAAVADTADTAVVFGTAASQAAEADVVELAAVALDRVEPRRPRAAAMRSGCAVVKSSEAELPHPVRNSWGPCCADKLKRAASKPGGMVGERVMRYVDVVSQDAIDFR